MIKQLKELESMNRLRSTYQTALRQAIGILEKIEKPSRVEPLTITISVDNYNEMIYELKKAEILLKEFYGIINGMNQIKLGVNVSEQTFPDGNDMT